MAAKAPPVRLSSPAAPPGRARVRRLLIFGFIAAGMALVLGVLLIAGMWLAREAKKAEPIAGITITVDASAAPHAEEIEHAARAFLQRRLRAAGYEPPPQPLAIDVVFQKIGVEKYEIDGRVVEADRVRLEIGFRDAAGKRLKTLTASPPVQNDERVGRGDAGILLNKQIYNRTVDQILSMDLPAPVEFETRAGERWHDPERSDRAWSRSPRPSFSRRAT